MVYFGESDEAIAGAESSYGAEASSYDKSFDWWNNLKFTVESGTEQVASLGAGVKYVANVDKLTGITGSMTVLPVDSSFLEYVFGSVTGSGTSVDPFVYSIASDLPSLSVKAAKDSSNVFKLLGVKVQSASFKLAKDDYFTVDASFLAKSVTTSAETLTKSTPSLEPFTFLNGTVKVDGSEVGKVETVNITLDRGTEGGRGVENTGDNNITYAVPKTAKITVDLDAVVDSDFYSLYSNRTDHTMTLTVGDGVHEYTFSLTGARFTSYDRELSSEAGPRTVSLKAVALDMTAQYY